MYRLQLPRSDYHSQVKVIVSHPLVQSETTLDDSHYYHDITLPAGASYDDLGVLCQFILRSGQVDQSHKTMIMKEPEHGPQETGDQPDEPDQLNDSRDSEEGQEIESHDVHERQPQSPGGERPSDAPAAGDDRVAPCEPDGLDEPESDDASSPLGEAEDD